jgi:hypothetical protein
MRHRLRILQKAKLGTLPLIVDRVPSFGSVWIPMLAAYEQTLCELYKMYYAISKRCNRRGLQEVMRTEKYIII